MSQSQNLFGCRQSVSRLIAFCSVVLLLCSMSSFTFANLTLEVIDGYADLHTGPGRGYPKFFVIEQGESITVLAKRPGWYEVQIENGKTGWVTAKQISRTLQKSGEPADLPTVSYGDYLTNSWRVGFAAGEVSGGELKGADLFTSSVGYRFNEWFEASLEAGRFFRSDTKGELYGLALIAEPFSQYKLSPFVSLGLGQLKTSTQDSELAQNDSDEDIEIDGDYFSFGFGVNYYVGRNFIVKAEFRGYEVSTDNDDESLDVWKIGFNTFF